MAKKRTGARPRDTRGGSRKRTGGHAVQRSTERSAERKAMPLDYLRKKKVIAIVAISVTVIFVITLVWSFGPVS